MEQRSTKLQGKVKKVQSSSCIWWGLVDIFDFRNGRSNQKLLSNGRRVVQKVVSDFEHSRKVHTIASSHGKRESFEGYAFEESMKNLKKQKFGNTKMSKKQKKANKNQLMNSDIELINHQLHGYRKKSRKLSIESDQRKDKFLLGRGAEQSFGSSAAEISLDKHKLKSMCEEICSQIYRDEIRREDMDRVIIHSRKDNELDHVNMQLLQFAAKAFVDQIYTNGESLKSKYFADALDILDINMDLFLKLLQEPNSLLLKGIDNLQPNPAECRCGGTRNDQDPAVNFVKLQKKNSNNPLWKKLKHRYGCSSKENTTSQASNMIVILKPVSTRRKKYGEDLLCECCSSRQVHKSLKNKDQIVKSAYFFKDIKRKFKQAVGENQQMQQRISMDESLRRLARNKRLLKEDVEKGKSSGSDIGKSAFSSSSDAKRKEKTAPSVGTSSSSDSFSKKRQTDIFSEAKRHLSVRLRNIERGENVPREETPRTLKMILSSPEHDLLATGSPKRDKDASTSAQISTDSFENGQRKGMDFPCSLQYIQEAFSHDLRRLDEQLEIPENSQRPRADAELLENSYSVKDDLGPNGSYLEASEAVTPKRPNILEIPFGLSSMDDAKDRLETETMRNYEENGYMQSSNLMIPVENHSRKHLLESPRPLNIHELEIENTTKYKEEHTSPVSVLEPFLSPEYVNSRTSIMSKSDEYSSLQPRRIAFDDPTTNTKVCTDMEEEEPLHVYVKEIIEASDMSFSDEIYQNGSSQQDILYKCVADIMESYSFESYGELLLLVDCIHEVLSRIYSSYFGYPPWLSFLKRKIRPVPQEKEVVGEVVKEIDLYLLQKEWQPTLDQLVEEDFMKSAGSWLDDLCVDTEEILIQIAEDVLQDSIEEAVLEVHLFLT